MAKSASNIHAESSLMKELLATHDVHLPIVGEVIEGLVIAALNNEVFIDIHGVCTGVVRGPELIDESGVYSHLQPGDTVAATVVEQENERGEIELSFRLAGHKKAWEELETYLREQKDVAATILDANKGGLLVRVGHVSGFLPVSQLTVEHYPRVEGGNKNKILERLQTYIGQDFTVRVIDADETEEKLIVSEKAAKEHEQSALLSKYNVGDTVEGKVTGVVDFGAFVEFDEGLEGLVHISELAWQRIDDPRDIIHVGDNVRAQIISVDHGKISLSIRRLAKDPWENVLERYHVGDTIEGKVLKINPFGAFVELDEEIHGLAHISELSWEKIQSPEEVLKTGEMQKFKIVSIEPDHHRLGLSLKQMKERPVQPVAEKSAPDTTPTIESESTSAPASPEQENTPTS